MPELPVSTALGYVGIIFLIFGAFLIVAGFGIINIQQVTVKPGRSTWILGITLLIIGIFAIFFDVKPAAENLPAAYGETPPLIPTQALPVQEVAGTTEVPSPGSTPQAADTAVVMGTAATNTAASQPSGEKAAGETDKRLLSLPPEDLLIEANMWPIVLGSTFEIDDGKWPLGEDKSSKATKTFSISDDGQYQVSMSIVESVYYEIYPALDPVSDFYLSADFSLIQGRESEARFGLIFRKAKGSFYAFRIEDGQYYRIRYWDDVVLADWINLTEQLTTSAIYLRKPNRLTVIGVGEVLYFYINDKFVEQILDTRSLEGNVGLIVNNATTEETAIFGVDNFVLRSKP